MMSNVLHTYAAYVKNEELRAESSSGGIFTLIAEQILSENGIVYGVKMTEDCCAAVYSCVKDREELAFLRGSKYVQAVVGDTYSLVKKNLETGIKVLFTGTGCQINGLKGYLGKDYQNLYCMDVVCHGVPSPELWCRYVAYVEKNNNAKLRTVNFRCKENGWKNFGIKSVDTDSKAVYVSKDKDPYMQMFLKNYSLRPSCFECAAKNDKRADISIADFWGIEAVAPQMDDGQGTSLVLVRTDKGRDLFETILDKITFLEVPYEEAIKRNSAEFKSVVRPVEREDFFKDMKGFPFERLIKKYGMPTQDSMKRKIKKVIKAFLMHTPARKLWGIKTSSRFT